MGRNDNEANSLIRFSLGRETSEEEIYNVLAKFPDFVQRNRSVWMTRLKPVNGKPTQRINVGLLFLRRDYYLPPTKQNQQIIQ